MRPGNPSPFNVRDHVEAVDLALAQLSDAERGQVLIRTGSGGCSKALPACLTGLGLEFSVEFSAHGMVETAIDTIPAQAWRAAIDGDGNPREGAQVAELTAWMSAPMRASRPGPQDRPPGMRVLACRENPHYA